MRVTFVITQSDSIGGAHIHVRDLAAELRRRGHAVSVLVGGSGPYIKHLIDADVHVEQIAHMVRQISPIADARAVLEIRRALLRLNPDLVSTHSSKAGWLGRIASCSVSKPAVFTAHGWAFTEGVSALKRTVYRLAEKLVAPLTARIITVSEYDRALAESLGVGRRGQLVTVHNGMPDVASRANPSLQDVMRIAMVARFDEPKDFRTLVAGLRQLTRRDWVLELIGDGPLQKAVRDWVRDAGIAPQVEFAGTRSDVAERLARAQLFVLTSKWEGLPRSIIEAMRAGLPVVASNVGGVRELVDDGQTGFLVPRSDPTALAERVEMLLNSAELRSRMGAAGRERYDERFTFERMVQQTLQVYEQIPIHVGGTKGQ